MPQKKGMKFYYIAIQNLIHTNFQSSITKKGVPLRFFQKVGVMMEEEKIFTEIAPNCYHHFFGVWLIPRERPLYIIRDEKSSLLVFTGSRYHATEVCSVLIQTDKCSKCILKVTPLTLNTNNLGSQFVGFHACGCVCMCVLYNVFDSTICQHNT